MISRKDSKSFSVISGKNMLSMTTAWVRKAITEWQKGKREKMADLKPDGYWRIDQVF